MKKHEEEQLTGLVAAMRSKLADHRTQYPTWKKKCAAGWGLGRVESTNESCSDFNRVYICNFPWRNPTKAPRIFYFIALSSLFILELFLRYIMYTCIYGTVLLPNPPVSCPLCAATEWKRTLRKSSPLLGELARQRFTADRENLFVQHD